MQAKGTLSEFEAAFAGGTITLAEGKESCMATPDQIWLGAGKEPAPPMEDEIRDTLLWLREKLDGKGNKLPIRPAIAKGFMCDMFC